MLVFSIIFSICLLTDTELVMAQRYIFLKHLPYPMTKSSFIKFFITVITQKQTCGEAQKHPHAFKGKHQIISDRIYSLNDAKKLL